MISIKKSKPYLPKIKHLRARLDQVREINRVSYSECLKICKDVTGREIKDIGELSPGEIGKVLGRIK